MSRADDPHGPAAGCRAYECGVPNDAYNCPFTLDARPVAPLMFDSHTGENCKHEWRQVITAKIQLDLRFFCIRCLIIVNETESKLYHISAPPDPENMI